MSIIMHGDYELSEQLFLDLWKKYHFPEEITDKNTINSFLNELVILSKGWIILDHYSSINFDNITRIETDGKYTKILWKDYSKYLQKYMDKTISEDELLSWQIFGYFTYQSVLMDIAKLSFIKKTSL